MPRQRSLEVRIAEMEDSLANLKLQKQIATLKEKLPKRKKRKR